MHYYAVMSTVKKAKHSQAGRVDLGQTIRRRRDLIGLSQEAFAEKVDCHRNYVSLVERGEQNVTIEMLRRIASALKCTVADLVQEAGL